MVVTDFISFLENPKETLKFFISYEISGESAKANLTLNAGELEVTSCIFYEQMSLFENKSEIYRDLLAITSITNKVDMTIQFEKLPKTSFQDFLKYKFGFFALRNDNDEQNVKNSHINSYRTRIDTNFHLFILGDLGFHIE